MDTQSKAWTLPNLLEQSQTRITQSGFDFLSSISLLSSVLAQAQWFGPVQEKHGKAY
jgi:hypothetical protein